MSRKIVLVILVVLALLAVFAIAQAQTENPTGGPGLFKAELLPVRRSPRLRAAQG